MFCAQFICIEVKFTDMELQRWVFFHYVKSLQKIHLEVYKEGLQLQIRKKPPTATLYS